MEEAFHQLKVSLCNHCVLCVPCANDSFQLHTDTSRVGIGAVLNVLREGQDRPVAFFSRQLRDVECRYSATELESSSHCGSSEAFQSLSLWHPF